VRSHPDPPPDENALILHGYSAWPPERVLDHARAGRPLGQVPGDFVLVAADGPRTTIVTSVVGARPYFYAVAGGRMCHGSSVYDVVRDAGLPWRWNADAIRSVAWMDHTIDGETLHPDVRRVPPASVLEADGGSVRIREDPFWATVFEHGAVGVDEAAAVLEGVCDELLGRRPLISLSAGFESRALLARALARGVRPVTVTMGHSEATDQVAASLIARDLGLDHLRVDLPVRDYLAEGPLIARLTSGTKPAAHWHTFLYSRHAADSGGAPHVVGSNGEFARSFYFDKGAVARALDALRTSLPPLAYYGARLQRQARRLAGALPFLGGPREAARLAGRVTRLCGARGTALERFDRFYTTQRVRHFIGNGLALYAAHCTPVSPFLDARWIAAAAGLPRAAKLGSNFHRRVIERNAPDLLRYPTDAGVPMARRAPRGYWRAKKAAGVGYSPFAEVLAEPATIDTILESEPLDEFVDRAGRRRVIEARDAQAMNVLLTLHFAAEAARDATRS
jgi:hypothetical protein